MNWKDLTQEKLYALLKPYIKSKHISTPEAIKIFYDVKKKIELDISINRIDEALKRNCKWKSDILVHVDLHQGKGELRGIGRAVDNFKELKSTLINYINQAKEW